MWFMVVWLFPALSAFPAALNNQQGKYPSSRLKAVLVALIGLYRSISITAPVMSGIQTQAAQSSFKASRAASLGETIACLSALSPLAVNRL